MNDLDLGWENAGGNTEQTIQSYREVCLALKHQRKTTNEGLFGTMHTVSCDLCGYSYHYDSGD